MTRRFESIDALVQVCSELKVVMSGAGRVGRSGRVHQGQGQSTPNNLVVIANLVAALAARRTLETGMAYGTSTLAFLAALQETTGGSGSHTAIDPFQKLHYDDCGVLAAERAGLGRMLQVQYRPSSIALAALLEAGAPVDLIYVDGSHLFEDAFVDAYYAVRLLKPGGVVLFDDCTDGHIVKLMRFLKSNLNDSLEPLDLAPWRAAGSSDWRYRLARRSGKVQLTGFRKRAEPARDYGTPLARF